MDIDIWDVDKLKLFIGFVIPGFVSMKTYELLVPSANKESSKKIIDAIAYSCINYALLIGPIYEVETSQIRHTWPNAYIIFYVFVLLLAPVLWAVAFVKLRNTEFIQGTMPHPSPKPWDYVFGQRKAFWLIVTMKDGKKVGGKYGASSFTSSAPAPEQIFLEEAWKLNDDEGFERPRSESAGIMVLQDIATIEFFNITHGDTNDREETTG
jgi:hypothetical protein